MRCRAARLRWGSIIDLKFEILLFFLMRYLIPGLNQNTPNSGSVSLLDMQVKTGKARKTARFGAYGEYA
jgi:hypothetical protein